MKIKCVYILMLLSTVAFAGFDLPRGIFRMSELDEARAKAEEEKKAITFVLTDEKST